MSGSQRHARSRIPADAVRVTVCEYEALKACLAANNNDHRKCRKEIEEFEAGTACKGPEGAPAP